MASKYKSGPFALHNGIIGPISDNSSSVVVFAMIFIERREVSKMNSRLLANDAFNSYENMDFASMIFVSIKFLL